MRQNYFSGRTKWKQNVFPPRCLSEEEENLWLATDAASIAETQLQVVSSRLAQPSSGEQRISPKYASETLHSSAVSMNREN